MSRPFMWCRHCQQEAPAVGPTSAHGPRCARCHRTTPQEAPAVAIGARADTDHADDDQARREIYRALRSAHATLSAGEAARTLRFDLGHTGLAPSTERRPSEQARPAAPRSAPRAAPSTPDAPVQVAAWGMAGFGALLIGLGIGLVGWSLLGGVPGLWNPGLAAAVAGQGIVILGLMQIVATLWSAGRQASVRLGQMHHEVRLMRRAQEESAGRHSATAASFYSDLARDAAPDVLLGNLQGQVDRLSARLRAE